MTCGVMLAASAAAATPVASGTIDGHSTWTAAASPYLVQGDLTIAAGAELELEPGVEVRFANHDPDAAGLDPARVEFIVEGTLRALGTSAQPILFGAAEGDFANSWAGVRVTSGAQLVSLSYVSIEAAATALDSSANGKVLSLEHCVLRKSFDGLHVRAGTPTLFGLSLESNSVSGLYAETTSANIELELRSTVTRLNGSCGVLLSATQGRTLKAVIVSSTVYGNTSAGVTSKAQGAGSELDLTVADSIVAGNGILGIDASALDEAALTTSVRYSDVYGNGMDFSGTAPGEGCIAADPSFVDAPWDLRLSATSPCIGSADPSGGARDMGAYAYEPLPSLGGAGGAGEVGAGEGGASESGESGESGAGSEEPALSESGAGGEGVAPLPGGTEVPDAGCGCHAAPRAGLQGAALLAALGLGLARRRRARA